MYDLWSKLKYEYNATNKKKSSVFHFEHFAGFIVYLKFQQIDYREVQTVHSRGTYNHYTYTTADE